MTTNLYTSRTPAIQYQRCKRLRYLSTHFPTGGAVPGLEPVRQSVALTMGGCWHAGAAFLLDAARLGRTDWRVAEDDAVTVALVAFHEAAAAGLDVEAGEALAQATPTAAESLAEFGAVSQEDQSALMMQISNGQSEFDRYLAAEQACLLEGLVRAWARRGLPRLLEEYEVLEVEREGRWELAQWGHGSDMCHAASLAAGTINTCEGPHPTQTLWFLSRPDALLRHRQTGDLVLQSFKTTGAWDRRKEKDAGRDVQGLTEGVEVEQRLADWWGHIHTWHTMPIVNGDISQAATTSAIYEYLATLPAPPRISAIRYEYILKGPRTNQSRLSTSQAERFGFVPYVQQSKLCYLWASPGMTAADAEVAHSFAWTDEATGKERKLAWQKWQQVPVWDQPGGVRAWIELLDRGAVQPEAGRDVLAECVLPPLLVYRQDDDLLDVVEQLEAQETQVAEDVAAVNRATDEGDRRSELNRRFPQSRSACSYPGECAFVHVCYGSAEARRDPMGTGRYKVRVPNHPLEGEGSNGK